MRQNLSVTISFRAFAAIAAAGFVAGCAENSNFVRFNNPLPAETQAVKRLVSPNSKDELRYEDIPVADEARTGDGELTFADAVHPGDRPTHGKVCYQCNGKGYILPNTKPGSDFVVCEHCRGKGRL